MVDSQWSMVMIWILLAISTIDYRPWTIDHRLNIMLSERSRLTFTIENVYGGFAQVGGLLRVNNDLLILEFQTKDTVFGGLLKSRAKEKHLPLQEIESVEYKKKWFSTHIIIRVYRMGSLDNVPGSDKGEIKLKLKKKDRSTAQSMVSRINLRISELRLDVQDRGEELF